MTSGAASETTIPQGKERILLVEDNPTLRQLGGVMLEELGYTVVLAENGVKALERATAQRFDLVITDLIMPEMNGKTMADRLQVLHPETRVLFTSGYSGDTLMQRGLLNSGIAFLQKPYTHGELASEIREILDHDTVCPSSLNVVDSPAGSNTHSQTVRAK
jgi:CheY-like chemotaxis protein